MDVPAPVETREVGVPEMEKSPGRGEDTFEESHREEPGGKTLARR
jgi:hypothetical protein